MLVTVFVFTDTCVAPLLTTIIFMFSDCNNVLYCFHDNVRPPEFILFVSCWAFSVLLLYRF